MCIRDRFFKDKALSRSIINTFLYAFSTCAIKVVLGFFPVSYTHLGGVLNTCKSSEAVSMKFSDGFEIDLAADGLSLIHISWL